MASDTCGDKHSWGEWRAYDAYPYEMGLTDGFQYRRECCVAGCTAIQRAERLVPEGKTETREHAE